MVYDLIVVVSCLILKFCPLWLLSAIVYPHPVFPVSASNAVFQILAGSLAQDSMNLHMGSTPFSSDSMVSGG